MRVRQKKQRNGVVAQLGERLNGIQEAKSSILFISTRISRVYDLGRKPFFRICKGHAVVSRGRVTRKGFSPDCHGYVLLCCRLIVCKALEAMQEICETVKKSKNTHFFT